MGCKSWSLTVKPCDSCKAVRAAVFCGADYAFLCQSCDAEIHGAAAASPHARVPVCEVCEQAAAAVTCKADAAALCAACDADIHSANPLARRHERLPVVPFYDAVSHARSSAFVEFSEEEAEAASWLLPGPNIQLGDESGSPEYRYTEYLLGEMDPYLDLDLVPGKQKSGYVVNEEKQYSSDGVVPVQSNNEHGPGQYPGPTADGFPACHVDYPGPKPLIMYNFASQSISQSVSTSSSLDVGVVPDHGGMADISNTFPMNDANTIPTRLSGIEREARVLRYREKRKNRKFEKTIRYASRKAYAETRPRIKGRFAKRPEHEVDAGDDTPYVVVPTF